MEWGCRHGFKGRQKNLPNPSNSEYRSPDGKNWPIWEGNCL
jgi:hypothetical protein